MCITCHEDLYNKQEAQWNHNGGMYCNGCDNWLSILEHGKRMGTHKARKKLGQERARTKRGQACAIDRHML